MLHSGNHQNDVWFAEEDEEENDGCFGVCLVFSCHVYTQWWKLDNCCAQIYTCRMNPDERFLDAYILVS